MRTVNYAEYQKKRQTFVKKRAELNLKKAPARRVRDPKERELLLKLDLYRWQQWLATGKLQQEAPRVYRLT